MKPREWVIYIVINDLFLSLLILITTAPRALYRAILQCLSLHISKRVCLWKLKHECPRQQNVKIWLFLAYRSQWRSLTWLTFERVCMHACKIWSLHLLRFKSYGQCFFFCHRVTDRVIAWQGHKQDKNYIHSRGIIKKIKVCLWNTTCMPPAATKSKKLFLASRSKSRSQGHWPWCHLKGCR